MKLSGFSLQSFNFLPSSVVQLKSYQKPVFVKKKKKVFAMNIVKEEEFLQTNQRETIAVCE